MPRYAPVILALTLSLTLAACTRPSAQGQTDATTKPIASTQTPTSVRAITVRAGALTTSRSVSATLEASVDSNIAAQTSGQVVKVFHREGDRVAAGSVIAQLDDTNLRQQLTDAQLSLKTAQINLSTSQRKNPETTTQNQSSLQSAQISLDKAQKTYDGNLAVYKIGGLSQTDLDASKANLAQAQASFEQAQASLAQSQRAKTESLALLQVQIQQAQNKIAQTQNSLSQTQIKAPFSGEIAELSTEVGEFVNTGAKVFRLVDTSSLRAKFSVPSADADGLQDGKSLSVTSSGKRFDARVTRTSQVAGTNRLVQLYGRFVNPCRPSQKAANCQDTSSLTAGATVRVGYALELADGVIVPTGALQTDSGQNYVYVIKDSKAVRRDVTVLGESSGQTAVRGIIAGNTIVFPVPGSLQSGEVVAVVQGTTVQGGGAK